MISYKSAMQLHLMTGMRSATWQHALCTSADVIVALYALRVEYGHCRIRIDTASGKSWAVDLLNYGMLLGSPAAQQLRNCPAACIHGVAPRSMQVNVKQR